MAAQELIEFGRSLSVPGHPVGAAVVGAVKVACIGIGGLMLLSWFTGTKSETEFFVSPKDGVKFKHKVDKREADGK